MRLGGNLRVWILVASTFALPLATGLVSAQPMPGDRESPPERVELASSEVTVPFRMEKGRPVIDLAINGKGPYAFVLDTGAGGTVLGADLVRELALPTAGEVRIGDPINPHAIAASLVRMERVTLGGAVFTGVAATSMENSGFPEHLGARGVLGMPVFAELLLTLDYGRRQIRIGRGELPAPDGKEIVSSRPSPGPIRVAITVGSLELDADLDTGSPGTVSLPDKYMDQLPLEGKPVEVGHARTVSAEFVVYGATLKGTLRIAGHRLENPSLRFNPLPNANIGNEVLQRFVLTIDQKTHRIQLREGSAPIPSA
jgi:hypothetical protein